MAERDLSVVAGQNIQAEKRDRVGDHQRELKCTIVAQEERQTRLRPAARWQSLHPGVRLLQIARDRSVLHDSLPG